MKLYITLTFLLILSAFGIGYYSYRISDNYNPSAFDKFEIRTIKRNFLKSTAPDLKFIYSDIYPTKRHKELLLPISSSKIQNKEVFYTDKDCFRYIDQMPINFSIEKVISWERFRCGNSNRLPASFFQYPPFVHPSGISYVYLFYKLQGEDRVSKNWLKRHLRYLNIDELRKFQKEWDTLPNPFNLIASLDDRGIESLVSYSNIFVSGKNILLLDWDVFNFFEGTYKVYSYNTFKEYLKRSKFTLSDNISDRCLYREGNLCWNFSLSHIIDKTGYMNISMTVVLLIFVILSCIAIYALIASERKEDEKRKFALRILGHELRTPVTGMMLKLESLLKDIDKYEEDDQIRILKISSDAHRLRRLIEMSRNYLTASNKDGKKEGKASIESIKDFLERFYDDYPELQIELPSFDYELFIDAYWLQVCLKNLIENAFFHGVEPVVLSAVEVDEKLHLSVQDAGECEVNSFEELSKEFYKGNKSQGTGLGLNIVKKILKDLKLKLNFQSKPTRFSIIIERSNYGKNING